MSMLGYEDTKEINEIFLNQLIEMEGGKNAGSNCRKNFLA